MLGSKSLCQPSGFLAAGFPKYSTGKKNKNVLKLLVRTKLIPSFYSLLLHSRSRTGQNRFGLPSSSREMKAKVELPSLRWEGNW